MKTRRVAVALAALLLCSAPALAAPSSRPGSSAQASAPAGNDSSGEDPVQRLSKPLSSTTHGTVTVEGKAISHEAVAGRLVLGGTGSKESTPQVAMGYFACFKQGADPSKRPITFVYNGGRVLPPYGCTWERSVPGAW